jgi:hypothetical protein
MLEPCIEPAPGVGAAQLTSRVVASDCALLVIRRFYRASFRLRMTTSKKAGARVNGTPASCAQHKNYSFSRAIASCGAAQAASATDAPSTTLTPLDTGVADGRDVCGWRR